ncbi:hypothetical protein FSP39_023250 [Pinctada imbricata]|uniref:NXF1/2/3/5-like leucine-rich repeat domain-containing protein n=1 Tax=Pinctada imbricata TaxID=66713 RepID=A0AA88YFG8_PINIB|nr:hypothetical protein FSP39_023250 [Pinctada imbricata]
MSDSGSVQNSSIVSHETGGTEDTTNTGGSSGVSSIPLAMVPAYKHLKKSGFRDKPLPELPSHRFQYSVWHDLREACLTGTQLKAPRVRDGPKEKEDAFYDLKDDHNQLIHHSLHGRRRREHRHMLEEWEQAKFASLSYQELYHKYQRTNFYNILGRLHSVEHLFITHNEINDLSSFSFPRCTELNLSNNYISSFKNLPKIPSIKSLNLEDNDIDSYNGLSRLKSTPITELYLNGNPVCFQINYRPKVFQILTQLKVLDGVNKLQTDLEFQDPGDVEEPGSNGCVIQ